MEEEKREIKAQSNNDVYTENWIYYDLHQSFNMSKINFYLLQRII